MYIDKSFQLLSADSGKVASDEARRQISGDDDAEFSELLGAELTQQEQQKEAENAAAADKKSGQEVAAFLTKPAKTTEQTLVESILEDKTMVAVAGHIAAPDTMGLSASASEDVTAFDLTGAVSQASEAIDPDAAVKYDTEQTADPDPWLAIISQSHDFNEILSQSSQQSTAAMNDVSLSTAETLAAELLNVAATEKAATIADQESQASETAASEPDESTTGHGKTLLSHTDGAKSLSDNKVLNIAEEQRDTKAQDKTPNTDVSSSAGDSTNSGSSKVTSLPSGEMTVLEILKAEQPHLQPLTAVTGEPNRVAGTEQPAETAAASGAATAGQATQLQMTAATVAGQVTQVESNIAKNSLTTPGDIELPIEVSPDIASLGAVVVESAKVTTSAKNAPQSFAQFQKAANAAAAIAQKQQLQAEQTQQPQQDIAVQQSQRLVELNQTGPVAHADTPLAFNALLQTERPISSSGGAMGSSTGQQQQQTASQIFASKLTDSIGQNEQPALNLLEPNAATQLKERVMFQVNQKIHSAEIKLAPEELGNMQIKVQLQQEQLSVQFVVQQAGAKEALEQQMPRLREMLEEQGLQLTEGQVSQQREGSAEQRSARERTQGMGAGFQSDDEPLQQQAIVRVSDRMVDYYA